MAFSSAEWPHPEIEYVIADGSSPESWKGVAAGGEGFRCWMSAWEDYRIEAEGYRELDPNAGSLCRRHRANTALFRS
jgi:hypothetical protein